MDKKLLRYQLETQAAALETAGPELCALLLNTCCALMDAAREAAPALEGMDELDRMELLSAALALVDGANALALPLAPEPSDAGRAALEEETGKLADRMAEQDGLKRELEELQARNKKLEQEVEPIRTALEEAGMAQRTLERMGSEYTLEKLQAQKEINDRLLDELNARRTELQKRKEERAAREKENQELEGELRALEADIQAQPAHRADLVEQKAALQARLDELRTAETACSPERQRELQAEIDRLTPVVEGLRETASDLRQRLEALRETHSTLDRDKQVLESDVLDCIAACLDGLEPLVTEHRSALEEVRQRADALAASVEECRKLRRRYAAWWDEVRTPLEGMEAALTAQGVDVSNLRATLDPGQCGRVQELNRRLEEGLRDLDAILERCFEACQQDQDRLEKRVSGR